MSRTIGAMGKKKSYKLIQVRISKEQSDFIDEITKQLGITSSDLLRMLINLQMRGNAYADESRPLNDQL